ncbi:hypothetical protein FOMPIDRAFT_50011 [Fomitopsis schrenkii]|uniref:Uncharacterized protein n=1 Tax=Fomitopsis schrenkii TaxID=2126942 RepID=S8FB16_FOMSC|nr:hypothetical protein FOMPIDRAFT_50011 [Fomitopsis schrenkii]
MVMSMQKAELLGAFLETLCYGVYLVIAIECVDILRRRGKRQFHSMYLHLSAGAMFIAITMHFVTDIARAVTAFTGDESAIAYYADLRSFASMFKTSIYNVVTWISDAFIVYRTFIVWGRNYRVALLPFLLFLGDVAAGIMAVDGLSALQGTQAFIATDLTKRTQSFYALTLSVNVICTILIAVRIWTIQRETAAVRSMSSQGAGHTSSLTRVATVLVESCAVYSVLLFLLIGLYAGGSPGMFVVLDLLSPVIGIVFFSVINRILRGVSHGDHPTVAETRSMQFNVPSSRTALSGTTDSSRSFGNNAVPVPLRAHAHSLEKDKGKAVISGSPYSLEMPDIAKPMTFVAGLSEV